jgi:hypothetical protein
MVQKFPNSFVQKMRKFVKKNLWFQQVHFFAGLRESEFNCLQSKDVVGCKNTYFHTVACWKLRRLIVSSASCSSMKVLIQLIFIVIHILGPGKYREPDSGAHYTHWSSHLSYLQSQYNEDRYAKLRMNSPKWSSYSFLNYITIYSSYDHID